MLNSTIGVSPLFNYYTQYEMENKKTSMSKSYGS
jgi:hypothetical protein